MNKKSFPYRAENYVEQLEIGQITYPILHEYEDGTTIIRFGDRPGRTNMSGEELVSGWLGCTNNVHATAMGEYRVISFTSRTVKCERLDKK